MSLTSPTPEEIRAFRAQAGYTQGRLADALAVSRRTVEEWESARNAAPATLRLAFAALEAKIEPWGIPLNEAGVRHLNRARARLATSPFEMSLRDFGCAIGVQGEVSSAQGCAEKVEKTLIDDSDNALIHAIDRVEAELGRLAAQHEELSNVLPPQNRPMYTYRPDQSLLGLRLEEGTDEQSKRRSQSNQGT